LIPNIRAIGIKQMKLYTACVICFYLKKSVGYIEKIR